MARGNRCLDRRVTNLSPGDEVWLVGERRPTGEQKDDESNLLAATMLKTLAATLKTRWVCEEV